MASTQAYDSDIEDTSSSQFNLEDWIGKGRIVPVPDDFPTGLALYLTSLAEIPPDLSGHCMPGERLTVQAFLHFVLPAKVYHIVQAQAKQCFSRSTPNINVKTFIISHTLPPQTLVQNLLKEFNQAVLDGMESVINPEYPDSRFPLWAITFWAQIWNFHDIQEGWRKGLAWLNDQLCDGPPESRHPFTQAHHLTTILRWNETTLIPGAKSNTTSNFASFLSNNTRMRTSEIEMMFSHLSDQIELDESIESHVRVETLRFWRELDKAKSSKDFNTPSKSNFLSRLEDRVRNGEIDYLLFPVYLASEQHWITFKLDFESNELSYGKFLLSLRNMIMTYLDR